MKYFAITPENCTLQEILSALKQLQSAGVSFLYVRSLSLQNHLDEIMPHACKYGINLLLPFEQYMVPQQGSFPNAVHFKSRYHKAACEFKRAGHSMCTASAHSYEDAVTLLDNRIHYVFISPVYPPISKPEIKRDLFHREQMHSLVKKYAERIVLLGGITEKRINDLKKELGEHFSVGGVSMFFS